VGSWGAGWCYWRHIRFWIMLDAHLGDAGTGARSLRISMHRAIGETFLWVPVMATQAR